MAEPLAVIETMNVADAEGQFGRIVDRVSGTRRRVVVEANGDTVAAVISREDLDRLNRLDAERDRDFAVFDEIGAAFADTTPEEIEREVVKAVAEVRAERKAATSR